MTYLIIFFTASIYIASVSGFAMDNESTEARLRCTHEVLQHDGYPSYEEEIDNDDRPFIDRETHERFVRSRTLLKCGVYTLGACVCLSVLTTPIVCETIYDNTAAIIFGVGWPALAASPLFTMAVWECLQGLRNEAAIGEYQEEEVEMDLAESRIIDI